MLDFICKWNYRVIRKQGSDPNDPSPFYYIGEVYYNANGSIRSIESYPTPGLHADDLGYLKDMLDHLKLSLTKKVIDWEKMKVMEDE